MQNYSFDWNGVQINVQIDKATGHKFSFVENGVTKEHALKAFTPSFLQSTIFVEWVEFYKDNAGNILNSFVRSYLESRPERFDSFYLVNTLPEPAGDFYGKLCINGMMWLTIGCQCFSMEDGSFYIPQPEPTPEP